MVMNHLLTGMILQVEKLTAHAAATGGGLVGAEQIRKKVEGWGLFWFFLGEIRFDFMMGR